MAKFVFVLSCVALCLQLALCQFGFFPQRDVRGFNVFGAVQNILENPRRTLQAVLNFGPDRNNQNRPGTNEYYEQYGLPNYPYPNEYYYNNIRYPNRDYNNGRDIVFEPTNNPFLNNYPNQYFNTRPNEVYANENPDNVFNFGNNDNDKSNILSTEASNNFETNNIPDNVTPAPQFGPNGIPDIPPGLNNNDIPTVPPPGVEDNATPNNPYGSESNNGIPDVPPTGLENNNGIPDVPPPGIQDNVTPAPQFVSGSGNNGIPDIPPTGLQNNDGIPTSSPSVFNDKDVENSDSPVTETSSTTLAPLTPVPNTGSRNNLNFGSEGIFCNIYFIYLIVGVCCTNL